MSADFDSEATAADVDNGVTSDHALHLHTGELGRKQPRETYALRTQSARAAIRECSCLSPRECGILVLIGRGYSNKGVARALGITAETVKWYVKRVFLKLDVNTRAHAVARAQSLGLFGLERAGLRGASSTPEPDDALSPPKVRRSFSEH